MDGILAANQPQRMRKKLNDLYDFGVSSGFLDSYKVEQPGSKKRKVDVLTLNKKKFEEFKKP
jgi:hypothetical protein